MEKAKPFKISKLKLWEAYQRVRRNGGAAGIDGMSLERFAEKERDHLYKLWNRMSSGCYFPEAVLRLEIPKKSGGVRPLGIPTVLDRVAQMTARMYLEPLVEPHFHPDSYGYRPKKSAHQAVETARQRCWKYDWVIDLDIKGFFDTIDHELMLKAVDHHNPPAWVRLYIERWLKAPSRDKEGVVGERTLGTPQGGVISPLLANLFLHYAFDNWLVRNYPETPFERYADDMVIHCRTYKEAEMLLEKVKDRLKECHLAVHPEKTKIVYCKDRNRALDYDRIEFDFLGYTFRPRRVRDKAGRIFLGFTPAIGKKAKKAIQDTIRSWKLHRRTVMELEEISGFYNSRLRGWLNYYGRFRVSELTGVFKMFQAVLIKWARNKYKKLHRSWIGAGRLLARVAKQSPKMFVHWAQGWYLNGCI